MVGNMDVLDTIFALQDLLSQVERVKMSWDYGTSNSRVFFVLFFDKILYSSGWPRTHCVIQAGLKLMIPALVF
jgi:phage regulator Rha-like protein